MEEDILNYSVMFRGTPCMLLLYSMLFLLCEANPLSKLKIEDCIAEHELFSFKIKFDLRKNLRCSFLSKTFFFFSFKVTRGPKGG